MGKNRITPVTLRYMLINAGFWMSFCLVTTYAAVFLQGIGFSNSELGVAVALGNVGSALLSTFLGSLIDRNPKVTVRRCAQMTITRDSEGPAHYDGEPVTLGKEIHVRMIEGGLKVLIPNKRRMI